MVLLTIVTNSNPRTLYFDHPIEKPSYIRLLFTSIYNSWYNLKEEAIISKTGGNGTVTGSIFVSEQSSSIHTNRVRIINRTWIEPIRTRGNKRPRLSFSKRARVLE